MENISLSSILKFLLIRNLTVLTSVFVLSFGATASEQNQLAGRWQSSDGKELDGLNNPRYTFEVTEPGYADIRLENISDACVADPYLHLINEKGIKTLNDDWRESPVDALSTCRYNSRLFVELTKGTYTLVAATFNDNETGDFNIGIKSISSSAWDWKAAKISDFKKQSISRRVYKGSWAKSGGTKHQHKGNPRYTIDVEEGGKITIRLTSETDTYLYLLDKDGFIMAENDDSQGTYNSLIDKIHLDKGTYTIVAATYADDMVGNFTLLIESIKTPSKIQQVNFSAGEDFSVDYSATNNWLVHKATGGSTDERVTYQSSDQHVAVSLGSGTFRINGAGTTTITATKPGNYRYHDATDSVQLTVLPIRQPSLSIGGNKEIIYSANVPPYQQEAEGGAGNGTVTYHSSNPHILPVNKNGVVDILGVGETTITATKKSANYYDISAEYKLTVKKGEQPDFSIGGDIEIAYHEGKSFWQESHRAKGGIKDGKLTYTSSNPNFTIGHSGAVIFTDIGETTITVKNEASNYHDVEAQYRLTVKPGVQPDLFIGSDQQVSYEDGFHKQIAEGGLDVDGAKVEYLSSNEVLPVDQNGRVSFKGTGKTTITAKKSAPNYLDATAQYVLTVKPEIRSTLSMGEDVEIAYTHNGSFHREADGGSDDDPATYSSSNPNFIVNKNGKVFFGDTGKTTITAKKPSSDGTYIETGKYNLTVTRGLQDISFGDFLSSNSNIANIINKKCGDSFTLQPPKTNLYAKVSYKSEDESVATVDNNGKVTVVGVGNTKIIAKAAENSRYLEAETSFELNVEERGQQAIQFKGENPVLIYGEANPYKKVPIDGWGDEAISYDIVDVEFGAELFDVDYDGQVSFDYKLAIDKKEWGVWDAKAKIIAFKPEDSCYHEAESSYEIWWEKNGIYPPKVGETADKEYNIQWTMPDYKENEKDNKVTLYYSNLLDEGLIRRKPKESPDPNNPIGVRPIDPYEEIDIAEWAEEIGVSTVGKESFIWDTSELPEGDYYIYAIVENKSEECELFGDCEMDNEEGFFVAQRPLVVKHDYGLAMDCSSMNNYSNDKGNAPNTCPDNSMALLNNNGNIIDWGKNLTKPNGEFSKIYPTNNAYAALDKNGKIDVWGEEHGDSLYRPMSDNFTNIYTSAYSFAAKRKNDSVFAWNKLGTGEVDNVDKLISSGDQFIALKKDGSISIWGEKQSIVWWDSGQHWFDPGIYDDFVEFGSSSIFNPVGKVKRKFDIDHGLVEIWDAPSELTLISVDPQNPSQYAPGGKNPIWTAEAGAIKLPFYCRLARKMHEDLGFHQLIKNEDIEDEDLGCDLTNIKGALASFLQADKLYRMKFTINTNNEGDWEHYTISSLFLELKSDTDEWTTKWTKWEDKAVEWEWKKIASKSNYIDIRADKGSGTFIALTDKGVVEQWTFAGQQVHSLSNEGGYIRIFASKFDEGYFAIKANGSTEVWGMTEYETNHVGGATGRRNSNKDPYSWEDFGLQFNLMAYLAPNYQKWRLHYVNKPEQKWNVYRQRFETVGKIRGLVVFYEPEINNPEDYMYIAKDGEMRTLDGVMPVYFTCETTRELDRPVAPPKEKIVRLENGIILILRPQKDPRLGSVRPVPNGCDLTSVPEQAAKMLEMNKKYNARIWVQVDKDNYIRYHNYPVRDNLTKINYQAHTFTVELDHRGLRRGIESRSDLLDLQLQDAKVHSNVDGFLVDDLDGLYFWGTQLYSPFLNSLNYDLSDPQQHGAQIHVNEAGENAYSGGLLFGSDNAMSHSKPVTKSQVQSSTDGDTSFRAGGKIFSNSVGTVLLSEYDGSIDYISVTQCLQGYTGEENCHNAPTDSGYINIYSTSTAFAGLKADGSITTWGSRPLDWLQQAEDQSDEIWTVMYRETDCGEQGGPTDKGYISIKATKCSFTAIKADGTMTTWGTLEDMNIDSVPNSLE